MRIIYVVCANENEALEIGQVLVETNLAACVNILPKTKSIYRWNGEVQMDEETILLIKTTRHYFEMVEQQVRKLHSYEVPAIFEIPIERVSEDYAAWLKAQLK